MTHDFDIRTDSAGAADIEALLRSCDAAFVPPLSSRVEIGAYARKIVDHARRIEACEGGRLVGLLAMYCDDLTTRRAFITSVSVSTPHARRGIAGALLRQAIEEARAAGMQVLALETSAANVAALALYCKHGFNIVKAAGDMLCLDLTLSQGSIMDNTRDYNAESKDSFGHQYAYGFDFDVMHPYMIKSFAPWFRQGSLLELGCFKGALTRRLLEHSDDVTCVEASGEALQEARVLLDGRATLIHARFEAVELPRRYDNIVLTHVLEHLDDPVGLLRRINDEWLAPGGRLFLVCPNANAPSRQIAVKMGLIEHNAAVTLAERDHGHRRTYSLDTLERDAVAAGLAVRQRSGIFFKALANFQWDRLLQTDIVSPAYLDGCYALGQQYPDLCASIFLLCEQGPVSAP
ncbi:GNAT family N-acetyltransferase [Massilia sp. H6]|uniref:GNAT family N-acetyltransferase n=1 Tax=Massilia sp. H6 TaxID=2970464 RepID=UPI002169D68C|nr:GNAT family N-acetyltransferase [Massilia sp. H6]UVW29735.1 GNAT family N-acetyltransferase [Massilia sp. H6]